MPNFGASFKQARESKGISLDRIAKETRISTRFLQAIENEEFHLLPGGIFNRGFVRTYAEKIGLDTEQAVADYERLAQVREPAEVQPPPAVRQEKSDRKLYPVAIVGLILLIIVFYVVTRESSNIAQTASAPPAAPAASPTVPATPATPAPGPPAAVQPSAEPAPPNRPPVTTSAAPEPAPVTPAPKEVIRVDIQAKEETWIKVDADGKSANPGEILEPGMTRHFGARNSLFLAIGNAGGLDLKINDMAGKDLGKTGKVRELNITPANIKDFVK
jgi:cytoskeleton protein RodZ